MTTKINKTILAALTAATASKSKMVEMTKGPKAEQSGFMMVAVLSGFDLVANDWDTCRVYLKDGGIKPGTINAVARFMAPNPGHARLAELLKGCDKTLEARQEHLAKQHLGTYNKLAEACIIPSAEALIVRAANILVKMSPDDQAKAVALAKKIRLDAQAKGQASDTRAKQVALVAITTKKNNKAATA